MTRATVYLSTSLAVAATLSCSKLEPRPEDITNAAVITVDAALDGPDATGSQLLSTVTATLPAEATTRDVTFTASGGFFVENATKTIVVRAEPNADASKLIAVTRLRDTITQAVIVRGAIADRYDTTLVAFVKRP